MLNQFFCKNSFFYIFIGREELLERRNNVFCRTIRVHMFKGVGNIFIGDEKMAKELNYKEIGLRIKTLRLKNNIYQTVLAKEIGVSQTHMSNIESGRAGLTLENLVKMSKIFNCGIDEIVFGEVEKKQEQGVDVLKNCTMQDIIQAMQMLKSLKN